MPTLPPYWQGGVVAIVVSIIIHIFLRKDMGSNPVWGVVTPVHSTVMVYLALLCGCLEVEVFKTNSCTSLYGRLINETFTL